MFTRLYFKQFSFLFNPWLCCPLLLGLCSAGTWMYFFSRDYYKNNTIEDLCSTKIEPQLPKYVDKYLDKLNKAPNSFKFQISDSEYTVEYNRLLEKYNHELASLQLEYEEMNDFNNDINSDGDSVYDEEDEQHLLTSIAKIKEKLDNLQLIVKEARDNVTYEYTQTFLKHLANNYVFETTPIGNVMMVYSLDKNGFKYYSDKVVSNFYLNVVCRKYVCQFNCKPLYVPLGSKKENLKEEIYYSKYFYEGKLSNMNILKNKTIKSKAKNERLTFSDFKKKSGLF